MEEGPLVSIAIPAYNSGLYISRALQSCIQQTYKNIEIVVSDNASTDNTKEIVLDFARKDKRVKYFRNETNIGSGFNFLKANEHATGFYSQALGSDDWLSSDYIEEALKTFKAHPDSAAVIANIPSFKLENKTSKLSFIDELNLKQGHYSVDWFYRGLYLGYASSGFISFMRREDVVSALEIVLKEEVNFIQRGDRMEPFDMPIFLEIISKYKFLYVNKKPAYLKTVHGKEQVGLQGGYEGPDGKIIYAIKTRKAYELFFKKYNYSKHLFFLKIFSGLSIVANMPLVILKNFNNKEFKKYFYALKESFKDFNLMEIIGIIILILPYILWRLCQRISNKFKSRTKFVLSKNYFLNDKLEFNF